jgi:hypothetical protein
MRHLSIALLLPVLLLVPAAQVVSASDWQIKPFFGSTFGGSTTLVQPELATGGDISGNPKLTLGVSSFWLGEVIGIEGDVGHTSGFFNTGKGSATETVLNSGVTTYTGNLVVALPRRLTEYTLRPYIIGGAGLMHVNIEDTIAGKPVFQFGSDNLLAYDIGGGVTGFLTDHIGVSWDIRRFSALGGQNGILNTVENVSEHLSFWRANMSVAIRPIRHVRSTR